MCLRGSSTRFIFKGLHGRRVVSYTAWGNWEILAGAQSLGDEQSDKTFRAECSYVSVDQASYRRVCIQASRRMS